MKDEKLKKTMLKELRRGIQDEEWYLVSLRRKSQCLLYIPSILLGGLFAEGSIHEWGSVAVAVIATVLGILIGLSVLFSSSAEQWSVISSYLDHDKVLADAEEYEQ